MARMVRKQVYLESEQNALIKRRAAAEQVTEAEIIRRCIGQGGPAPEPRFPDRAAWYDLMTFLQERANRLPPTGGTRGWTRDDLYEDRLERFSG